VRRTSFQKDGYLTAGQTPSEADTEIDIESVPKLLADNVAIKYGFDDAGQREAADIDSGKKPFRDAIVGPEMLSDISMERPKSKKLMRFFLGKVENEANESFTYTRPIRRQWAIAVSAPKPAENVAASDTKINTQKPAILIMSTASQQDSKEIAIKESTTKLEKTPSNYLESPISPSHSPDVRPPAADLLLTWKCS
jgi:hypothetical protein